jgi:hypothetical protein
MEIIWKEQSRPKPMKYPNICIEELTSIAKTQLKKA